MSQSLNVQDTLPEDDSEELTIEDVITAFLKWNATPTEEQVQNLAELCGVATEEFEAVVYRMFGEIVGDDLDYDDDAVAEPELDDQSVEDNIEDILNDDYDGEIDPLDLFIISYFLRNPDPTDEQIQLLSSTVGLNPAQLEERLFAIMSDSIDDIPDEDEDNDDSVLPPDEST
jgi:hypothetical protein